MNPPYVLYHAVPELKVILCPCCCRGGVAAGGVAGGAEEGPREVGEAPLLCRRAAATAASTPSPPWEETELKQLNAVRSKSEPSELSGSLCGISS